MDMQISFTKRAQRAVNRAQKKAAERGHDELSPDHLMLGICLERDGSAAEMLRVLGLSPAQLAKDIDGRARQIGPAGPGTTERILQIAAEEAHRQRQPRVGTGHILFALLREREGTAATMLQGIKKDS
jgi:ATP-dependent Clp protease ATP-binding subunit ClpC